MTNIDDVVFFVTADRLYIFPVAHMKFSVEPYTYYANTNMKRFHIDEFPNDIIDAIKRNKLDNLELYFGLTSTRDLV